MNENERIAYLEKRIQTLEKRVTKLEDRPVSPQTQKNAESQPAQAASTQEAQQTQAASTQETPVQPKTAPTSIMEAYQAAYYSDSEKQARPVQKPAQSQSAAQNTVPKQKDSSSDMESKVGKQLMGIIASILIFIGLCFLAVLIYPYVKEEMKFIAMYVLSIAVFVGGLLVHRKYQNAFTLSLSGCGIGMIYISFVLTRLYFEYINDYVLYGLFFLWIIGTVIASKRLNSFLFQIISLLGFAVSILIGIEMITAISEVLFLNIFQSICIISYLLMIKSEHQTDQIGTVLLAVFLPIIQIVADVSIWRTFEIGTGLTQIWYCLSVAILLAPTILSFVRYLYTMANSQLKTAYLLSLYFSSTIFALYAGWAAKLYIFEHLISAFQYACGLVVALVLFILMERKGCTKPVKITGLVAITLICMEFTDVTQKEFVILQVVSHLPLAAAALIVGWKRKDIIYSTLSVILILVNAVFLSFADQYSWPVFVEFVLVIVSLLGLFCLIPQYNHKYHAVLKLATYVVLLSVFYRFITSLDITDGRFIADLLAGVITLALIYSGFAHKWNHIEDLFTGAGEEEKNVLLTLQIIAELILLEGLFGMNDIASLPIHWLMILLCLGICAVNMTVFLKRQKEVTWMGYLWGFRITVVVLACVFSFLSWQDYALLGTIIGLVLAVLFILCGFRIKQKPLRLYGLCLTVVCVLKLLLVDIAYDNSIMRVIGFISGGILCFAISWAYNHLSKQFKEKEADTADHQD